MSTRTDYLVLLPTRSEGIDYGYLAPLRITATTYEDAVRRAVEEWWSGQVQEGTAIVVPMKDVIAFVLGEIRGVEVVAQRSVPDLLSETPS